MYNLNPNGSSNFGQELDAPASGTNNVHFRLLRAQPDMSKFI